MEQDPFAGYLREEEPERREKGYAWHTAIGLQKVDRLEVSEYLIKTAKRNIEGEISFEQAKELFLRNLLLEETNELHNRSMHISGALSPMESMDDM